MYGEPTVGCVGDDFQQLVDAPAPDRGDYPEFGKIGTDRGVLRGAGLRPHCADGHRAIVDPLGSRRLKRQTTRLCSLFSLRAQRRGDPAAELVGAGR
jgi:hypothetical protein